MGPSYNRSGDLIRKERDIRELIPTSEHTQKAIWGCNKKTIIHKPGREVLPETNPDGILILDF